MALKITKSNQSKHRSNGGEGKRSHKGGAHDGGPVKSHQQA